MLNILSINSSTQITMIVIWVIVIALAIVLEEQTAQLVSIWFAAGAIGGIIGAILKWEIYWQLIIFAGITFILVIATRPIAKKLTLNTEVKTNADKLVGMKGKLTKTILPDEKGEIKIDYQYWTAISVDNKKIEEGEVVVVKDIVGNKLVVDLIEEIDIK
jgi:membrane protein implicated in regulation of membrane protease activity